MHTRTVLSLLFCWAFISVATAQQEDPGAKRLQGLLDKSREVATMLSAAEVRELLKLGEEHGRVYEAAQAARNFLRQEARPPLDIQQMAARSAYLSGDYRTAVARYKSYLDQAPDNAESAESAAIAYMILIEFLQDVNDAYQLMAQHDAKFRQSVRVRQFDPWFMAQALKRKDYLRYARRLQLIFNDKQALPQERLYYWDELDALMADAANNKQELYEALPSCKQIYQLIREDRHRQLKYQLGVFSLAYNAGRIGKDDNMLRQEYDGVVLKAANAYFNAYPNGEALKHILQVLAGGPEKNFDPVYWREHKDLKQAFFVQAFPKIPAAERSMILDWRAAEEVYVPEQLATPEQWAALGQQIGPELFNTAAAHNLHFLTHPADPASYKQQATFLQDVSSGDAAVIRAMADGKDLADSIRLLIERDSWGLEFGQILTLIREEIFPAYRQLPGNENVTDEQLDQILAQAGQSAIVNSPVAIFSPELVGAYLLAAFESTETDTKDAFLEHLQAFSWMPYSDADERLVYKPAYDAFRRWAADLRRDPEASDQAKQLVSKLEASFKAIQENQVETTEPPNALTAELLAAREALAADDDDAFGAAARKLYEQVKTYEQTKPAFGKGILFWLIDNAGNDLQREFMADQLAQYAPAKPDWRIRETVDRVVYKRANFGGWSANRNGQAEAEFFHKAFADAMSSYLDRDLFWGWAFNRFRATRRGHGWSNDGLGMEVMRAMIEKQTFIGQDYRPHPEVRSGATSYMYLLEGEFRPLYNEFRPETYFDDMFVAEAKDLGYFDVYYLHRGRDQQKKVADAVAMSFAAMAELPLGYGDQPALYDAKDFFRWHDHAMNANDGPRRAMLDQAEKLYGKTRYDAYALGRGFFHTEATTNNAEGRQAFFSRLSTYVDRAATLSVAIAPPRMQALKAIGTFKDLSAQEADIISRTLRECSPPTLWRGWEFEVLPAASYHSLVAHGKTQQLYEVIPHYWCIARDVADDRIKRQVAEFSNDMMERELHGLVAVHTLAGAQILGGRIPGDVKGFLLSVRSKALTQVGGAVAVARTDPRYPIYQAQADYLAGNTESAWEMYLENARLLPAMIKELDTQFTLWLVDRLIDSRDFDTANNLARQMIQWMDNSPVSFDKETRARVLLTYADIPFAMEEYPRARAQYERLAAAKEFDGTRAQLDANLRVAEVDRLTRQYDAALERLEKLLRLKNPYIQLQAYYQLAKVTFDQEEYQSAKDYLQQVFLRNPNHFDARILEGEINLKLKRLVEASKLRVGLSANQRAIVPGKPLEVSLEDQNLSIVGKTRSIEIRAWTDSGDEEVFSLLPFGETKTKFQGQLQTALGPVNKGDKTLQLLGSDTIYYQFSERFRKEHGVEAGEPATLTVATDAELYVSSGEILTQEQLQEQRLEMLIRRQLRLEGAQEENQALRERRRNDQVKPGNPIYIRLIDGDRSLTNEKDKVSVRVETSSGDVIPRAELVETDTHSGIFEGTITTGSAQATAYASDSKEGVDPNYVISSGDYPPWIGLPDNQRPKLFSVDLNDNVQLKMMQILSEEPGRHITSMIVQTSLNARDFETVAIWPGKLTPWDGQLQAEIVKYQGQKRPGSLVDFKEYLEATWYINKQSKEIVPLENLTVEPGRDLFGKAGPLGIRDTDNYLLHIRGAFWLDRRQVRLFRLEMKERGRNASYLLTVDGKVGESNTEVKRSLAPGLHTLDVYIHATRRDALTFDVLTDVAEPPYMIPCPPEMFDVKANPKIAENLENNIAMIDPSGNLSKIMVNFPEGANARVLRMILVDFETDAPAINKITLFSRDRGKVLPTEQDFRQLKENDQLEIVPGDRITVSYNDPRVFTGGNDVHEGFLSATFSDAQLQACFVDYRLNRYGVREVQYIPLRRFKVGDKVNIYLDEPDGDVTESKDTLEFQVKTPGREAVTLQALETEDHSGIFIGTIFPVQGEPQKATEISVKPNEEIKVTYLDKENTDPGIPWEREIILEQAVFDEPELRVYQATSQPITERQIELLASRQPETATLDDYVEPRHTMVLTRPLHPGDQGDPQVFVAGPLVVELMYPPFALTAESQADLYVQTSRGRAAAGVADDAPYDVNVPGTIKLTATPNELGELKPPPGYLDVIVRGDPKARDPLDDGRFTFKVPVELGMLPDSTLIGWEPETLEDEFERPPLSLQGNDTVYIGFKYTDEQGQEQWLTQDVSLTSDVFFDAMDRKFQSNVDKLYVGETLYVRVLHQTLDVSDDKDSVSVRITSNTGQERPLELQETFGHTGNFKGLIHLVYHQDQEAAERPNVLPVDYGDELTLIYSSPDGTELAREQVSVYKGDDGEVYPFTKRFSDRTIAVQTQFMIAEAYFELAKKHHTLGQESLARREMAQAKKLLDEAVRDNPDLGVQAQAEYLLANLTYEYADLAENNEIKQKQYLDAVARFNDIVATFPDSPYAPKAQYKKGLVYEKMGNIDAACEEYVKLSYRYPDNELVAETIARLGQYFLTKGKEIKDQADSETDPVQKEKFRRQYVETFTTAAQVFRRLSERFPDHNLADKTIMLSAQCYMRAEDLDMAIQVFVEVAEDPEGDKDLRSESMYWAGHCYMEVRKYEDAYKMFKKLTWDYPETKWAKYARGRLTDPSLSRLDME